MIRQAAFSVFLALAGCAASPGINSDRTPREDPSVIFDYATGSNTELRERVEQERIYRVDKHDPIHSPHDAIKGLVLKSKQPALQVDGSFVQANLVATGQPTANQNRFAEVMADALLQEDFACTQPVYADYLQLRYGEAHPTRSCDDKLPFILLNQQDGAQVRWLDIKQVSEIHLVFTGPSHSIASRFGHVSLRLVVCPKGVSLKDDCDRNLYEHYSLGFLAQVDELSLSTFKALTGSYRAYLFARPFMDAYEEYAIHEFRGIYSLPLKLNSSQRERLLRGLAEIHWQYEGQYYFFGNNCAGMLQQALRVLLPEYAMSSALMKDYIRPDHFFAAVKREDWADGDTLRDMNQAEREGYYFPSTRAFYEKALLALKDAGSPNGTDRLENYLRITPAERDNRRKSDNRYIEKLKNENTLRDAEVMLEQYAMFRSERTLFVALGQFLKERGSLDIDNIGGSLDSRSKQYIDDCFLTPVRMQFKPVKRYLGIPESPAIPEHINAPSRCNSAEGQEILAGAFDVLAKDTDAKDWTRIRELSQYWADTIKNIMEIEGYLLSGDRQSDSGGGFPIDPSLTAEKSQPSQADAR